MSPLTSLLSPRRGRQIALLIAAGVVALLAVVTSILSWIGSSPEPLRIGISAFPVHELLHLAKVKGYFEEKGVEVEIVEFGDLQDVARGTRYKQLHGATLTTIDQLMIVDKYGLDLRAVYVLNESAGADRIVTSRIHVTHLNALKDRRVGVETESAGFLLLREALLRVGLSVDDIKVVPTGQVTGESAMTRGEIDALVTYPPYSSRLLDHHQFISVFDSSMTPGLILDVLVFHADVLERRSADVEAVLEAIQLAMEFAASNPMAAYSIMAERESLSIEAFKEVYENGLTRYGIQDQSPLLEPGGDLETALKSAATAFLGKSLDSVAGSTVVLTDPGPVTRLTGK